mmetsp:Transcript_15955/g.44711  ORF Transcript_15955/g.44711 Transcript_15955/m.44711 type:complete len:227 (+) Transcript_15955:1844-2524(+)
MTPMIPALKRTSGTASDPSVLRLSSSAKMSAGISWTTNAKHVALTTRTIDFGRWSQSLEYSGTLACKSEMIPLNGRTVNDGLAEDSSSVEGCLFGRRRFCSFASPLALTMLSFSIEPALLVLSLPTVFLGFLMVACSFLSSFSLLPSPSLPSTTSVASNKLKVRKCSSLPLLLVSFSISLLLMAMSPSSDGLSDLLRSFPRRSIVGYDAMWKGDNGLVPLCGHDEG